MAPTSKPCNFLDSRRQSSVCNYHCAFICYSSEKYSSWDSSSDSWSDAGCTSNKSNPAITGKLLLFNCLLGVDVLISCQEKKEESCSPLQTNILFCFIYLFIVFFVCLFFLFAIVTVHVNRLELKGIQARSRWNPAWSGRDKVTSIFDLEL